MSSLLSKIDTAHSEILHDAQIDYFGSQLATCASDNNVKVFRLKDDKTVRTISLLKGHCGPVWRLSWAHPRFGNILASCSYDRKVIVWKDNGRRWLKWYEYSDHNGSVNAVSFAPQELGLILSCGSSDGTISVLTNTYGDSWDVKKINQAHAVGVNSVHWCPSAYYDSKLIKQFASGGCDNLVKIWQEDFNEKRWENTSILELHTDWVRDVSWAPSTGLPQFRLASCSQDKKVIIWQSDNGLVWKYNVIHVFDDVVWSLSWNVTGHVLAVTGGDNKITLWRQQNNSEQWVCITNGTKDK